MEPIHQNLLVTSNRILGTIELTEFGDCLCPRSLKDRTLIDSVLNLFKGKVTYLYRHYPNLKNDQSLLAALAAEAAKRQGKFWSMYHALMDLSTINCHSLVEVGRGLGLDEQRFLQDLLDDRLHSLIKEDWKAGHQAGIGRAPTLFVNGHQFHGKLTLARLVPIIQFHIDRSSYTILSTVDRAKGMVYWSGGELG